MIINRNTMQFQIRSDKPNENWLNDNDYLVIDDNSELAHIVRENYPFIDLEINNNTITNVIVNYNQKNEFERKSNIINQIQMLKELLSNTDYQAIKYAEGQITENEYSSLKQQRQTWRDEINNLEEQLI